MRVFRTLASSHLKNHYPLCFWKLRNVQPEVHILGSLHNVAADAYPLADHIEAVLDRAEIVMFEVSKSPASPSIILRNTSCKPIEDRLAHRLDLLARLKRVATTHCVDLAKINADALWLIGLTISGASLTNIGKPMSVGVDNYIRKRCDDRAVFELLETGDEMVSGLTEMSAVGQILFLEQRLKEVEGETLGQECEVERAWRQGNVEYFSRGNVEEAQLYPEQHQLLLLDRNVIWSKNIRRVLALKKRILIVGGAAHFVGVGSVLQLLKREYGIRADRIGV
jgi:uncharacterized protein YbaP (TraB family)